MRGVKAKRLRKMATKLANPEYRERMYTVRKQEHSETINGKVVKRTSHTFINATDSIRRIYQKLKQSGGKVV